MYSCYPSRPLVPPGVESAAGAHSCSIQGATCIMVAVVLRTRAYMYRVPQRWQNHVCHLPHRASSSGLEVLYTLDFDF